MPREPHKRGSASTTRGLSNDKVCIPCAVSESGIAAGKIAKCGAVSYEALAAVFGKERINNLTKIISDSNSSYIHLAADHDAVLIQIPAERHSVGQYNIQRVNSFHTMIKNLINHTYRGVSSKHLNGYIAWVAFTYKKSRIQQRLELIKMICEDFFDTVRNILLYPPVPIMA